MSTPGLGGDRIGTHYKLLIWRACFEEVHKSAHQPLLLCKVIVLLLVKEGSVMAKVAFNMGKVLTGSFGWSG